MYPLTKDAAREIIDDFAAVIKDTAAKGTKPEKIIINFRNEKSEKRERDIYTVPISLLRFRKENGRIASDVYSYEKENGPLREDNAEDQKILAEFLRSKDPEKTDELSKSIHQQGQDEPAIITCDGFLINGNRRKLVFQSLWEKTKDSKYERMKVVILPGKSDVADGGPPTNREIEQIENRYQFFRDGKSEYSNFDRALSVRRKMEFGMSLEEQLKDDPVNSTLTEKEFKKVVQNYQTEFLRPLECVDRYLEFIGKPGMYTLISSSVRGKENRWQAFIDYYKYLRKKLDDPAERVKLGIEEKEVGKVEAIAFNLIRLRDFSQIRTKLHMLIRYLPGYISNEVAKKELLTLSSIRSESEDSAEHQTPEEIDKTWISENRTAIIRQVTKAQDIVERKGMQEKPVDLLQEALDRLNHERMDPSSIGAHDLSVAMGIAEDIRERAEELRKEFYGHQKKAKDFVEKHSRVQK